MRNGPSSEADVRRRARGYDAYGDAADGYGYAAYGPPLYFRGGDLDATQGLSGPGSTAYDQQGPYSSYAAESDRGGIFERQTTLYADKVTSSTSYHYADSDYAYSSYGRTTSYEAPSFGFPAEGGSPLSEIDSNSIRTETFDGDSAHLSSYATTYYAYTDGTYKQSFETFVHDYVGGQLQADTDVGSDFTVTGYRQG
ncbi:hypothetical protein D3272_12410 [Lichenibacterium ramalinae]|uniref:Uncharacterized protein n=1 Tax=Lichenibacterium ramalinae TaxID=2316527 RepID=A0A4Q2RBM6_9HYPH|nr:hypothetical protein D3272_12410 [Lichenibacterium ramalinae]